MSSRRCGQGASESRNRQPTAPLRAKLLLHAGRRGDEPDGTRRWAVVACRDAAVSGADPIDSRPGFAAILEQIASNGVRTVVVETANRFARDLVVQETGHRMLKDRGIDIIAADSPNAFIGHTFHPPGPRRRGSTRR